MRRKVSESGKSLSSKKRAKEALMESPNKLSKIRKHSRIISDVTKYMHLSDNPEDVMENAVVSIDENIDDVNHDITDSKQAETTMRESEGRFKALFEHSPVSLWEEDFSEVKKFIDGLRNKGVKNFKSYFKRHPEAVLNCIGMVKLINVNHAALRLYKYRNKKSLLKRLSKLFTNDTINIFREELVAFTEGKTVFESDTVNKIRDGKLIYISLKCSIVPGCENSWSRVYVSVSDISEYKRVEQEHKSALSLLHATLESTADGILVVDNNGKIVSFNQQFAKMWRIPEDILLSRDDDKALSFVLKKLKYPDEFLKKVRELYANPEAESFDTLEFRDGRIFERYSKPQLIEKKSVGRVWSFSDVTDRKLFELSLKESQRKYSTLISNLPGMVYRCRNDRDWTVEYTNEGCIALTGYSPSDFMNQKISYGEQVIHPDDKEYVWNKVQASLAQKTPFQLNYRIRTSRAGEKWVREQGCGVFDNKGKLQALEGFITDYTESKEAEDKLRESEQRFRTLFESADVGIIVTDKNTNIVLVNKFFQKMLGYTTSELKNLKILDITHSEDRKKSIEAYNKLSKGKKSNISLEKRYITKDGTIVWGSTSIATFPVTGSEYNQYFSIVDNITERKNTEMELNVINSIIQAINKHFKLDEIYRIVLDWLIKHESVDIAGIYIVDELKNEAVLQDHRGFPDDFLEKASSISYPKGVTWEVINTGKILNVQNAFDDPKIGPAGKALGFRSMLGIPISIEDKTLGVLWILSYKEYEFTKSELEFLTSIGMQIALSIAKAEFYTRISKQSQYEKVVSTITRSVHKSIDLQVVLDSAVESIKNNLNSADNISIYLVEEDNAVLKAYRGYSDKFIQKASIIPYPKGFTWKTIIEGKTTYVADVDTDNVIGLAGREIGTKSYYSTPLKFQSKTVGAININSLSTDAFDKDDLKLLETVADQIEIAFSHASYTDSLRKSEQTIRSITESTSLATGAEFFPLIVRYISEALDVPHTFISEYIQKENSFLGRVISAWSNRAYIESFEYDLKDMPCEKNTNLDSILYYPDKMQQHFPKYKELADMGVVGYLGVPITDSSNNILGILNIMDNKPINNPDELLPVLKIFAARAGAELERLRFEDNLKKFSSAIEQTVDTVIITDKQGVIEYANPSFEKLTGYSRNEAIGKTPRILKSGEHKIEFYKNLWEKILSGEIYHNVFINRKKGGELYYEEKTLSPIKDNKGNITHFVATGKDITDQIKIEEELIKAQKMESIGILAGGIAHDFNNLLTAILGNVSLANINIDKNKWLAKKVLKDAVEACERAKDLTYQLLTFSKGGMPIRKLCVIDKIVMDSAKFSLMGSRSSAEFFISDDLFTAEVDEGQISQVIQNLIINGDQAMPDGGTIKIGMKNVTIKNNEIPPLEKGIYLMISIEDQGIGILPEHINKIFDPYFTTKQSGSGLGLATSYSIIKNHDGYITVESKIGVGTKFVFYLPASSKKITVKSTETKIIRGRGKILIMDDDKNIGVMLNLMLQNLGYEIDVVGDGTEAIKLYKKRMKEGQPFNAVMLDLTVAGGMGGKETIARLLEIDPGVKAIVSSGYSSDPLMSEYKKYGFSERISKPYKVEDLSKVLNSIIKG